jgi:hypothetical protein
VAERFTAWVCGRSLAGLVGSKPSGGMHVCVVCCEKQKRKMKDKERSMDKVQSTREHKQKSCHLHRCVSLVLCVVRDLCVRLITLPGEFYRLCVCVCMCVCACDLETSEMRRPLPVLGCSAREKDKYLRPSSNLKLPGLLIKSLYTFRLFPRRATCSVHLVFLDLNNLILLIKSMCYKRRCAVSHFLPYRGLWRVQTFASAPHPQVFSIYIFTDAKRNSHNDVQLVRSNSSSSVMLPAKTFEIANISQLFLRKAEI